MLRIDAHQHFWRYEPVRDAWITGDMAAIQKDFLPEHLQPILEENGFDGCVVVQSDQTPAENMFQVNNALENDFIKAIVGWVDFTNPDLSDELQYLAQFKKIKGFRHILQGEPDRALMLKPAFKNLISKLAPRFTFDILIFADQLKYIAELARQFPHQKFVIDHLSKPYIKKGELQPWATEMKDVARCENVYCKVSGMVTEADWKNWKPADFHPYLDVVTETFGMKRLMYGSDWPVCLVASDYNSMLHIPQTYFASFSKDEQDDFFGGNAARFYDIESAS